MNENELKIESNWYNTEIVVSCNVKPQEWLEILEILKNEIDTTNNRISIILENSISIPSNLIKGLHKQNELTPHRFRLQIKNQIVRKLLDDLNKWSRKIADFNY